MKKMMKALVKAKKETGIWMEDVPVPIFGVNDVLIKVHKASICGTDIHIYDWDDWAARTLNPPLVIGHEFCGEVAATGTEVHGLEIGQFVSGEGHLTCGICRNCRAGKRHLCRNTVGIGIHRDGCFAEYIVMPASNVVPLPDSIPSAIAAILDPFGNAVHSALAFDLLGEDILITGAGPIGIMAAAIARHAGARYIVVSDVNEYRLDLAQKMGATRVVNVQNTDLSDIVHDLGMQEGFDVGLEMSGNPKALQDMLKVINHGGRIAILGIPEKESAIDLNQVIFKGLKIQGIYGREMFETWYKMITMLQSGLNIDPVITHHLPAYEYQQAFALMKSGKSGKVILDWQL